MLSSTSDHGTIKFPGPEGTGDEVVNFYWSPESLHFGDQVRFRIARRSYDGFCYATDIEVTQWAKDFKFQVSVYGITV